MSATPTRATNAPTAVGTTRRHALRVLQSRRNDRIPRSMIVRPGRQNDIDELWRIFRSVLQTEETYAMAKDSSRAEVVEYWTNNGPWFVADIDGAVVGACMIHPNQPGLGSHVANAAFVVDEAHRGRDIGRRLVEQAMDAARACGYRAMQFNLVVADNASAIHLYRSLGFEVIGRVPEAFHARRSHYVDALILHRFLGRA